MKERENSVTHELPAALSENSLVLSQPHFAAIKSNKAGGDQKHIYIQYLIQY